MTPRSLAAAFALISQLAGCEAEKYAPPPLPPAPPARAAVTPAAPPPPEQADTASTRPATPGSRHAARVQKARERAEKAALSSKAKREPAARAESPVALTAPAVDARGSAREQDQQKPRTAEPPAKAKGSVTVPSTDHVRIEFPSGLQADLDHDPRMQPWVNQVVSAIDKCYAPLRDAGAAGVIEVGVVMHENERPSATPQKLPTALTPMLACATGSLMRTKMPLFTGKEGTRYTLKIRLSK
jgi:hypothetical protein